MRTAQAVSPTRRWPRSVHRPTTGPQLNHRCTPGATAAITAATPSSRRSSAMTAALDVCGAGLVLREQRARLLVDGTVSLPEEPEPRVDRRRGVGPRDDPTGREQRSRTSTSRASSSPARSAVMAAVLARPPRCRNAPAPHGRRQGHAFAVGALRPPGLDHRRGGRQISAGDARVRLRQEAADVHRLPASGVAVAALHRALLRAQHLRGESPSHRRARRARRVPAHALPTQPPTRGPDATAGALWGAACPSGHGPRAPWWS